MRFRIKIITYNSGKKIYIPQKKVTFGWTTIGYGGNDTSYFYEPRLTSREEALERIDKYYDLNSKKTTIEFEYITKITSILK